jgi:hypothetical protein
LFWPSVGTPDQQALNFSLCGGSTKCKFRAHLFKGNLANIAERADVIAAVCCHPSALEIATMLKASIAAVTALGVALLLPLGWAADCVFKANDFATWRRVDECLSSVPFNSTTRDLTLQVVESTGTFCWENKSAQFLSNFPFTVSNYAFIDVYRGTGAPYYYKYDLMDEIKALKTKAYDRDYDFHVCSVCTRQQPSQMGSSHARFCCAESALYGHGSTQRRAYTLLSPRLL